jgi:hypothetical protein
MNRNLQPLNKSLNMLIDEGNYRVAKLNKLYMSCDFEKADKYFDLLDQGEWDSNDECTTEALVEYLDAKFTKALEYLYTCDQGWLHYIRGDLDTNIENELRRALQLNVYSVPGVQPTHSWTNKVVEECLQSYRVFMLSMH